MTKVKIKDILKKSKSIVAKNPISIRKNGIQPMEALRRLFDGDPPKFLILQNNISK